MGINLNPNKQNPKPVVNVTTEDELNEMLDLCDEVEAIPGGEDFAESVRSKILSFQDQVGRGKDLTPAQGIAVINMREGLKRWKHDE